MSNKTTALLVAFMMCVVAYGFVYESEGSNDANDQTGDYLVKMIIEEAKKSTDDSVSVTLNSDVIAGSGIGIFENDDKFQIKEFDSEQVVDIVNSTDEPITKINIDLSGHTYSVDQKKLVGSSNATQAMFFDKELTVTITNGTIALDELTKDDTVSDRIIQSYCDLTLNGVKLDGKNIFLAKYTGSYALSIGGGNVSFNDYVAADGTVKPTEIISSGKSYSYAIELCNCGTFEDPAVVMNGSTYVSGDVKLNCDRGDSPPAGDGSLTVNSGYLMGVADVIVEDQFAVDVKDAYISDESWLEYVTKGDSSRDMKTIVLKAKDPNGTVYITGDYVVPDYVSLGIGHSTNVVMKDPVSRNAYAFGSSVNANSAIVIGKNSVFGFAPSDEETQSSFTGIVKINDKYVELSGCNAGLVGLYFTVDNGKVSIDGTIGAGMITAGTNSAKVTEGLVVQKGASIMNFDLLEISGSIGVVFEPGSAKTDTDGKTSIFDRTTEYVAGKVITAIKITVYLVDKEGSDKFEMEVLPGWSYSDYFPVIPGTPIQMLLNGSAINPSQVIKESDARSTLVVNYSGEPFYPPSEKTDSSMIFVFVAIFVIIFILVAFFAFVHSGYTEDDSKENDSKNNGRKVKKR